jgi:DNA-binding NarL/FixJ family response regulator
VTRVLVISNQSMFSHGLEGLLHELEEIDLIDRRASVDTLPGCLEECRPDVLLFGCSDPADCPAPVFMRCLRDGMVQKVVCISLEDNAVYVFRGERHVVEQVQDLVEAIACQAPGVVSGPACCV